MKKAKITFRIEFDDNDVINLLNVDLKGSLDYVLFKRLIESVDKVRDEYNKEKTEE